MIEHIIYLLGPLSIPSLGPPRYVRVYEPVREPNGAPLPVLYMFDGQNVFHDAPSFAGGWHLNRAVAAMAAAGLRAPVVVGIDSGGASRLDELGPWAADGSRGRADELVDWLVETLVPRISAEFNVVGSGESACVGGSSMGGLCALYAHFREPLRFGGALAMSPSLWFAGARIFEELEGRATPARSRVYLDAGAEEGRGSVADLALRMEAHLRGRGYDERSLLFRLDERGTHSERDWRQRAPAALRFLFGVEAPPSIVEGPPPTPGSAGWG